MSDLIERQAAIDAIHCNITVTGRQNAELVAQTIGRFADRIKALPSAQPEIIYCRDCKYHHYEDDIPYCARINYRYGWKDYDFCSRAERLEECAIFARTVART